MISDEDRTDRELERLPATRKDVRDLTRAIVALAQRLRHFAPREEIRRIRRRVIFTILASVALALAATTLANDVAVSRCFLSSDPRHPPATRHNTVCNLLFHGYNGATDTNRQRLSQFGGVLSSVPDNRRRIEELERQVTELQQAPR